MDEHGPGNDGFPGRTAADPAPSAYRPRRHCRPGLCGPHLRPGQLIVLESSTYPGTTEDLLRPILEESGLRAGRDFFLAYSPEREDPGNKDFATRNIPKVVGGIDPTSLELAVALYEPIV